MAGRKKRMRSVNGGVVEGSCLSVCGCSVERHQIQSVRVEESTSCGPLDSALFESCSFVSRCSLRLIHEVVSKFDVNKRDIVKCIGFEGILHFPAVRQSNRRFALWLMSHVDERSGTLNIGEHISIKFTKVDVGHVFGVPHSGKTIVDTGTPCRESKDHVMTNFLCTKFWQHRSLKVVQDILEQDYVLPMSKPEMDNFKVAFVVFVVSNLLSPCSKHDYAGIDYWDAIMFPDEIGCYDWGGYVVDRLLEAVSKLKVDAANNIKFPNMTGCVFFLEVLYLDSLSLGSHSIDHKGFPRAKFFTHDKLRAMIAADHNFMTYVSGGNGVAASTLRDAAGCVYSWAFDLQQTRVDPSSSSLLSIWEAVVAMVHLLNIPLEAAGPVFIAAADFQRQINAGLSFTGSQAIKLMSVLVSIMAPYARGFKFCVPNAVDRSSTGYERFDAAISNGIELLSSPICWKRDKGRCLDKKPHLSGANVRIASRECASSSWDVEAGHTCSGFDDIVDLDQSVFGNIVSEGDNGGFCGLDGVPHYFDVDLRVATAMSHFYMTLRKLKAPRSFDLNVVVSDGHRIGGSSVGNCVGGTYSLPSPWELGYQWPLMESHNSLSQVDIDFLAGDDTFAIIHRNPKSVKVTGGELWGQLSGNCEFGGDLFDVLLRTVRQDDEDLYTNFGDESIVCGSVQGLDSTLRDQLSLMSPTTDLSGCKLMFFPAIIQCRWVCFVWAAHENVIYVFEPSYAAPVPSSRCMVLERCCYKLKLALQTVSESVRPLFSDICNDVSLRLLTLPKDYISPLNSSGAICYYFCRCFDGYNFRHCRNSVDPLGLGSNIFRDLLRLKNNDGNLFPGNLQAEHT